MKYEWLQRNDENSSPKLNPISFQFTESFSKPVLGKGGKLYYKRGRMNDVIFDNPEDVCYAVPAVWESPTGFDHDGYAWWTTKSEILAIRHYRKYGNAQYILKKKFDNIIEKQNYIYSLSKAVDSNIDLPQFKDSFNPRPHQKVGVEFGELTNGKFIIADQQRTGKSFTALMYVLTQKWQKCLIVCPAKVVPIWENMIRVISDIEINVLKTGDILKYGFNLVSYDSLHTIEDLSCDIAIADEAHFFIEEDARRSKAVNSINAKKRIALTGTPIMNNIRDIISILKWVDLELALDLELVIKSTKGKGSYEQSLIIGEELKRRCLLLRETNQVSTGSEPYINFIDLDIKLDNPKSFKEIGRAKVNYAVEYCKSFQDKILVIFYYKETGKMLKARFGDKAVVIDGDATEEEILNAKESFAKDTQIMCASSVLAEGHDMSHCNMMLLLEEPNYSMRTDQIRERCNRVNKQDEVTIDIVRIPGTRDDRVYELYQGKFDMQFGLRDG